MKKFVCVTKCTAGNPPRFYEPGVTMLAEKCPKHFVPANEARSVLGIDVPDEAPEKGQPLSQAGGKPTTVHGEGIASKMADEPATVEQVAEDLGVDLDLVKEAAGRSRKNDKLSGDEVSAVKAAIRVAQKSEPAEDGKADAADEAPEKE